MGNTRQGPGGRGPGRGPHRGLIHEKPKDMKGTLKRLVSYIGASRKLFFALLAVMFCTTLLSLAAPALSGNAIDAITLKDGQAHVDFARMSLMLSALAVVYVASSLLT